MKILLVCYGGLSTSILVNKMVKAISESEKFKNRGIEVEAWGKEEYVEHLDGARVILLGPQVSMIENDVKNTAKNNGYDIPVLVIDKEAYAMMDPVPVLKEAFLAIKNYKKDE